jgi:hypothetical protein
MGGGFRGQGARRGWRVLLTLFCVLLVAIAGTVQVAHTHADGLATHADCSLCAAAHVTVQLSQTPAAAPPVSVVTILETLPIAGVSSALSTFALFTRPPPIV